MRHLGSLIVLPLLCVLPLNAEEDQVGVAFFESRIRPVLVQHCYECHSSQSDELKGGLSLENAASVVKGGDSGTAVVGGKPDESLLLDALKYDGLEMPPAGKLTESVIQDFEKWIAMGAPDPREGEAAKPQARSAIDIAAGRKFWAFHPPVKSEIPAVQNADWPATFIDWFVLAELEAAGITPSPEIDKSRLLRRVTYDLTGLPPTEAELYAFRNDSDPQALVAVVDRLLASRASAEQWARYWLDVARYADSNGGDFNATFHDGWRYRNYVIDAYASDMPYDQFVREQLAGDLLLSDREEDRVRGLIAIGFLAVGPKMLSERDKLKLKMDVVDEQIDTMGKVFLGMTLGCCRCHDHKFDPIPTTDYYALAGIFRSTDSLDGEIQQYVSDYVRRPLPISPEHAAALAKHEGEKGKLKSQLKSAQDSLKKSETALKSVKSGGLQVVVDDAQAQKVGEWKASVLTKPFVGAGYCHDDQKDKGHKTIRFVPSLPEPGLYEVRLAYTASVGRASNVPVTVQHADGKAELVLNQRDAPEIDGQYHAIGQFRFDPATESFVEIGTTATDGHVIADAVAFVAIDELADIGGSADKAPLEAAVKTAQEGVKAIEKQIKAHDSSAPPPAPTAIAIREATGKIADCQVCVRGGGVVVPRGFLQVAMIGEPTPLPKEASGRRELAEWLADARHPLTARVYVNRVWQKLMGEGLVRSVDNFGELGDRPTHPALLDTLTVEFIEHGWSTRWLIRQIVLSQVYSQDSRDRPEVFNKDPENRKLWRANRKRMTAEQLRDSLLTVSGQLQPSDAGSPVQGMGKLVVDNKPGAEAYTGAEKPVRTIYLPVIRNEIPELLTVFDFADPDFVVGRRETTTIPAQALMMLNNPFVANAAKQTADRMLHDASPSDDQRLEWAAVHLWGRSAGPTEQAKIREYLDQERPAGADESAVRKAWSRTLQAMVTSTEFQFID
jgi:Protein of unknown function (DUF1553)/Protein of unknown function (DUF1549)/Planctomycete cytochrome C